MSYDKDTQTIYWTERLETSKTINIYAYYYTYTTVKILCNIISNDEVAKGSNY